MPFMLFVLGIPEDGRGEIELMRHPFLYENEAECLKAGEEIVRARVIGEHESATVFRVFCKPLPDADEYEYFLKQLRDSRNSRQKAR